LTTVADRLSDSAIWRHQCCEVR